MEYNPICFMFGHRDCPDEVFPELVKAVRTQVEENHCRSFVVGSRGNFDRLARRAVVVLKEVYPDLHLSLLTPYYSPKKMDIPEGVDCLYYPPGMEFVPKPFSIVRANEHMVRLCDSIICYVWHPASNTEQLLEKAKRRKKPIQITNLGENREKTPSA